MPDDLKISLPSLNGSFTTLAANRQQSEQLRLQRESSSHGGAAGEPQRIKKAATDFEAMMVQQMLKGMWQGVPGGEGMLTGSREEELFRDMLNEEVARTVAEQQSIGVRDIIEKEMKKTSGNR